METTADKKKLGRLVNFFSVLYCISYILRYSFSAVVVEVESAIGTDKSLLSIALTGAFITYGAGQIISGVCGDRFSPKKLLGMGLAVSSIMNLIIPFFSDPFLIAVIWCINGFAQAFTWPPLLRLMTEYIPAGEFAGYTQRVSWSANIGRILVYLIAPLLIWLISWKAMLFFSGACGFVMMAFWIRFGPDATPATQRRDKTETVLQHGHRLFTPVLAGILIAAVAVGFFRDGVQTWTPTFISEAHGLSNIVSILTGVFLPTMGVVFVSLATILYRKVFRNILMCSGILFLMGAVSVILYRFLGQESSAMAVMCTSVLVGSASGVNYMLTVVQPAFYKKYGLSSTAAGVVNAAVYVGSAAATYGIAALATGTGWDGIVFSWMIVAAIGALICLALVPLWKRKFAGDG